MFDLPISSGTFKRAFLGGDGQLEINSDQDAWRALVDAGKSFDPSVDQVADVKVSLGTAHDFVLGRVDTLKIGVSAQAEAAHQIQLIWPGAEIEPGIKRGLEPGQTEVLARLVFQGKADASAQGSAPVGPLKATFGVTAGGSVAYERLKVYPSGTPARALLVNLIGDLRLPQQATKLDDIPDVGEVVAMKLAGYLQMAGQVSYGYSVTGSREVEIGKLALDLDYALKLSAGLSAAYKLAGEYDIEARRGSSANFVRFVVRKSKDQEFNFAADFSVDADIHLNGLPDTADEFLVKAFGAHAERAVKLFTKARTYSDVDQLDQAAGKLLKRTIHEWNQKLIGKTLTNATLNEFLDQALKVVEPMVRIRTREPCDRIAGFQAYRDVGRRPGFVDGIVLQVVVSALDLDVGILRAVCEIHLAFGCRVVLASGEDRAAFDARIEELRLLTEYSAEIGKRLFVALQACQHKTAPPVCVDVVGKGRHDRLANAQRRPMVLRIQRVLDCAGERCHNRSPGSDHAGRSSHGGPAADSRRVQKGDSPETDPGWSGEWETAASPSSVCPPLGASTPPSKMAKAG